MTAVVIVAYNRPNSLERLLNSLAKAEYEGKEVQLIISIDKGNNQEVQDIANNFIWKFGKKKVVYQTENLGLRRHVMKCASLALEYESVIILEDDLYVSTDFYRYTIQALTFSQDKEYIAGISLYNHETNVLCAEPFYPVYDEYDNYYFQFASSWGQAWSKKQWLGFKQWYDENNTKALISGEFPLYIANWPDSSWLKFFIKYLVEKNKFFIFPRMSLTTNFGDMGTHIGVNNTNYQVPLKRGTTKLYNFSTLEESLSIYDVFYENLKLNLFLELPSNQICVDLYGNKVKSKEGYWLTRRTLNYKVIKSFSCDLRPHDYNIIENISGNDFTLYDTSVNLNKKKVKNNKNKKMKRKVKYNFRHVTREKHIVLLRMFCDDLCESIKKKAKSVVKKLV